MNNDSNNQNENNSGFIKNCDIPSDIKYYDPNDLINMKIERNNLSIQLLTTQKNIFQAECDIRNICMKICDAKQALINSMIRVERLQIDDYTKERENSINEIMRELDGLEEIWRPDTKMLDLKLLKLQKDFYDLMFQVEQLNFKIPTHGVTLNIKSAQKIIKEKEIGAVIFD